MKFKTLLLTFFLSCGAIFSFASNNSLCREAIKAIEIADEFIKNQNINIEEYKLVEAKNLVLSGNDYKGKRYWKITYKAKRTIDKGKGGEIFIEVDFQEKKAILIGYGE